MTTFDSFYILNSEQFLKEKRFTTKSIANTRSQKQKIAPVIFVI